MWTKQSLQVVVPCRLFRAEQAITHQLMTFLTIDLSSELISTSPKRTQTVVKTKPNISIKSSQEAWREIC